MVHVHPDQCFLPLTRCANMHGRRADPVRHRELADQAVPFSIDIRSIVRGELDKQTFSLSKDALAERQIEELHRGGQLEAWLRRSLAGR